MLVLFDSALSFSYSLSASLTPDDNVTLLISVVLPPLPVFGPQIREQHASTPRMAGLGTPRRRTLLQQQQAAADAGAFSYR